MNQVDHIDKLIVAIAEIRDLKQGFLTNFYLDITKHNLWINKGDLFTEKVYNTLFIVKKSSNFWNVFFCSTTIEELRVSLLIFKALYQDSLLIFDIVGKEKMLTRYKEIFDMELNEYCSLVRMSRTNMEQEYILSPEITLATMDQAQEVLSILNQYFDARTEQIPYLEEIHSFIEKENVLVYELEGKIIGFSIFEKSMATLYLRYWFVQPEYRNMKIGSKLLSHLFSTGNDCKKHQLWVIRTNENAIVRYEHYGFVAEDLYDVVYTNKEIKSEVYT